MKPVVSAFFNEKLTTQKGDYCAVGTIIFSVLGYRVRDWFHITKAVREGRPIPKSMRSLASDLDRLIGLNNLVTLEETFHNNELPLWDRVRRLIRISPDILLR